MPPFHVSEFDSEAVTAAAKSKGKGRATGGSGKKRDGSEAGSADVNADGTPLARRTRRRMKGTAVKDEEHDGAGAAT